MLRLSACASLPINLLFSFSLGSVSNQRKWEISPTFFFSFLTRSQLLAIASVFYWPAWL
jgi:hypothetical protein